MPSIGIRVVLAREIIIREVLAVKSEYRGSRWYWNYWREMRAIAIGLGSYACNKWITSKSFADWFDGGNLGHQASDIGFCGAWRGPDSHGGGLDHSACSELAPGKWPIHDEEDQIGHEFVVLSRIEAVRLESRLHLFSTFKEFLYPIIHRAVLVTKRRKA